MINLLPSFVPKIETDQAKVTGSSGILLSIADCQVLKYSFDVREFKESN